MQQAMYTAAEFVKVGACALLNGVEHPSGIGSHVVTTPVRSYDPGTGVIETYNTRYNKAAPPAKLYKPTHGVYPEFTGQFSAANA